MAFLERTRQDWQFLAKRDKRLLLSTDGGRAAYEREFKDAPLLFDGEKRSARGENGADRYNEEHLLATFGRKLLADPWYSCVARAPCRDEA